MAYDPNNLSALTCAYGFTLWDYKADDLSADVDMTGYFDEAANILRIGDFIMTNTAGVFIVRTNDADGVGVANISSIGLKDTD